MRRKTGRPIGRPKTGQRPRITIRLEASLIARIKENSARLGYTNFSEYLRDYLTPLINKDLEGKEGNHVT